MTESGSSFVVERLFEQLMRLLTLLLAVLFGAGLSVSPISILGGFGFILAGALIILWLINHPETTVEKGSAIIGRLPRVSPESARQSAADLLDNLSAVAQPAQFARVMLLSLVTWALFWGFFYLTLLSLADGFPAEDSLAISLGALALSPPSAPTQPGLFHASIVVPLSAVGFEAATLTAYAVLLHILEMVWMIGFGLWGMLATGFAFAKLRSARTKEP